MLIVIAALIAAPLCWLALVLWVRWVCKPKKETKLIGIGHLYRAANPKLPEWGTKIWPPAPGTRRGTP